MQSTLIIMMDVAHLMCKADVRGEWQAVSEHERPGSASNLFCMLLASGWPNRVILLHTKIAHRLSWLTHAPAKLDAFFRILHAQAFVCAPANSIKRSCLSFPHVAVTKACFPQEWAMTSHLFETNPSMYDIHRRVAHTFSPWHPTVTGSFLHWFLSCYQDWPMQNRRCLRLLLQLLWHAEESCVGSRDYTQGHSWECLEKLQLPACTSPSLLHQRARLTPRLLWCSKVLSLLARFTCAGAALHCVEQCHSS